MIRPTTLVAIAVLTQVVGCASIVNGQNQSLSVETRTDSGSMSGANCKLSNNKGTWFVTTPGSTIVQRSYEDLAVRCDKEAVEPGLASVKSGTKAMAFGNIIFGGVIGAGVDISTGAAYDYPTLITVSMGKTTLISAPPATTPAASGAPATGAATAAVTTTVASAAPTANSTPVAGGAPKAEAAAGSASSQ